MTDLPEPDPIGADRRRSRRRAKLPAEAACAMCGITDIDVLEVHHALGRAASNETTVVLCRNCHAQQTAMQHDHKALPPLGSGPRSLRPHSFPEQLAGVLASVAQLLHAFAHKLIEYSSQLRALIEQLDQALPGWRSLPAAQ